MGVPRVETRGWALYPLRGSGLPAQSPNRARARLPIEARCQVSLIPPEKQTRAKDDDEEDNDNEHEHDREGGAILTDTDN